VPSQHNPQLEHSELLGSVGMEGTELRINKKPVLTIKGQHRLVDHFLTKWTCLRVSSFPRAAEPSKACWWICCWLSRYRNYRSERRWVRGIRLGRLGSVVCISLNRYYFVLDRCQMIGGLTYEEGVPRWFFPQAFLQAAEPSTLPHLGHFFPVVELWLVSSDPQLPQWA